jgi:cupin fold WbuC family metalloprotein
MEPGTYVRPHRHPHTFELLLPLRGRFVVLNFDDQGVVTRRVVLGEACMALEMEAGTWHAVLSLDHGGVILKLNTVAINRWLMRISPPGPRRRRSRYSRTDGMV